MEKNVTSRLLIIEGAVSAAIERITPKSDFWQTELPSSGGKIWGNDLPYTEADLPSALNGLDFQNLSSDQKAMAVAASEFVWGQPIAQDITDYKQALRAKSGRGEKLSRIEETALNLGYIDTDMF